MASRRGALVLAVALVVALGPPATAADGAATARRVAGPDRYGTAAQLAVDRFPSASDAVLARGDLPADALAGAYVAGSHIGPVLLAEERDVPAATMEALRALGVRKVRIMGGPAALGPEVEGELRAAGLTVERIAGATRYETAADAARNSGAANVGVRSGRGATALLANGLSPFDALSAGPLSFGQQWPVLLTEQGSLPAATLAVLDELAIRHVVVVGGVSAVSAEVQQQLEAGGRTVERVAGATRESTAVAVAELMIGVYGRAPTRVELVAASSFADALALGSHAAPDAPVLLCRSAGDCGDTTLAWIRGQADAVGAVVAAGGTGVISDAALEAARLAAS